MASGLEEDARRVLIVRLFGGKLEMANVARFSICCPTKTNVLDSMMVTLRQHAVQSMLAGSRSTAVVVGPEAAA